MTSRMFLRECFAKLNFQFSPSEGPFCPGATHIPLPSFLPLLHLDFQPSRKLAFPPAPCRTPRWNSGRYCLRVCWDRESQRCLQTRPFSVAPPLGLKVYPASSVCGICSGPSLVPGRHRRL